MGREAKARCAAVVAWAVICAAVLWSDAWEPLAGPVGGIATLLATVGLALLLRWWAVPIVALGCVAVAVAVRPADEQLDTFLTLVVAVPLLAGTAGIAALVARREWSSRPGEILVSAAVVLTAVGVALNLRTVDHHPGQPVPVDLRTGAFADVRPGQDASRLSATRGNATVTQDLAQMAPLGEDDGELSGPTSFSGGFRTHRFRQTAAFVRRGTIIGYVTTDPDVELGKGVGIGDSISLVRERGLPFTCSGVSLGSDATRPSYPACQKRVRGGAVLWAGGDPIDSIWVVR